MRKLLLVIIISLVYFAAPMQSSAHVTVMPSEVGVAKFQTFTVSVPVEKEVGTTQIKLLIPSGLKHVTPNVKSGWEVSRKVDEQNGAVTELSWQGYIPAGYREEFNFSAQVPTQEGELQWKAYQTYEDGSIVEWVFDPDTSEGEKTPYSVTQVIDDLETSQKTQHPHPVSPPRHLPLVLSFGALILSVVALMKIKNK